jgi:hypothetical protein
MTCRYVDSETRATVHLIAMIIALVFQVLYMVLLPRVVTETNYAAFGLVGADVDRATQYENWRKFIAVAEADFVYATFLVLLAGFSLLKGNSTETAIDAAMVVVTFVWSAAGYAFVRWENARGMLAFYAFAIAEPAYIIIKLVQRTTTPPEDFSIELEEWVFVPLGVGAVMTRMQLLFVAYRCQQHFGAGLDAWIKARSQRRGAPNATSRLLERGASIKS